MTQKYFDKHGKEIKAGMSIYFGYSEYSGNYIPVVLHEGCLCFFDGSHSYIPLEDIDLSNSVINYDPEEVS